MLPLCFTAFVCFGVVLVLVGANQAQIATDLGLDLERSGLLGSALALGLGIGVVGAGPLFDRFARRPVFVAATLLSAAALVTLDAGVGFERLLLHVVVLGLGIGAYDTFISALVAERYRQHAARPMILVHAGATLGAVVGPLLIGSFATDLHWTASFRMTGLSHVSIAAWALFVRFPEPTTPAQERAAGGGTARIVRSPALLPLAAIAFAYVGIEASMTIFAVPYAGEALDLSEARGRAAISAFWLGLLVGRLAVLMLPGRVGPRLLVAAGASSFAIVLGGVWSASPHLVPLFAAVGLSLGCVFPLMITLAAHHFAHAPGTAVGLASGAGAVGGLLVPWLVGRVGDSAGIATGIGSVALWSLLIVVGGAFAASFASRAIGGLGDRTSP